MDRADLVTELTRIEIAINKLAEYDFEKSTELQQLLDKFCSLRAHYISHILPGAENFDQEIDEIGKNIRGLTSDNKGRDLEEFKSRIFEKSKKDLTIFINQYKDYLLTTLNKS